MANGLATALHRRNRTICAPVAEDEYEQVIDDPREFRRLLDRCYHQMPELFPEGFSQGYKLKDCCLSIKANVNIRRIRLKNGDS